MQVFILENLQHLMWDPLLQPRTISLTKIIWMGTIILIAMVQKRMWSMKETLKQA